MPELENRPSLWEKMRKEKRFLGIFFGDKVIWIIAFILMGISVLCMLSSSSKLAASEDTTRLALGINHIKTVGIGLAAMYILSIITWRKAYEFVGKWSFWFCCALLIFLLCRIDLGFIKAVKINEAWRCIEIGKLRINVSEVVRVFMVIYLAWAVDKEKNDGFTTVKKIIERNPKLSWLNNSIVIKGIYIIAPIIIITLMLLDGGNSSAMFTAAIMFLTIFIGGTISFWQCLAAVAVIGLAVVGAVFTYETTGIKLFGRVSTLMSDSRSGMDAKLDSLSRLKPGSKAFRDLNDDILQIVGAEEAIKEGGLLLGKGPGGSTQKYVVPLIFSDYMFSFIVEEYGLAGAIAILVLFLSLAAEGAELVKKCDDDFGRVLIGGLTYLIVFQAFMHIGINVHLLPQTGQTLPLLSDGRLSFLMFSVAFGVLLSFSRMSAEKVEEEKEQIDNMNNANEEKEYEKD